ncbi:MAG: hypothetical protein EXR93_10550 [Gemmatimonadetes bacterium]|nr:hypothetical protein [Gemmatimonadota bacterium]
MRSIARFTIAFSTLALSTISAQAPSRSCLVELDQVGGVGKQNEIRPGVFHQFGNGGVTAHCRGEKTSMKSDSVAWYSDLERMDLVGHAVFEDTTIRLDADRAIYYLQDQRLEAYGNVTLLNRKTQSRLTGPNLTYLRVVGTRDTAEMLATGHPQARYRSETDSANAEPYFIKADRMRFRGNTRAWAGGGVSIDRSDFSARSDSSELDLGIGGGFLVGHAEARGQDSAGYVLTGRTIRFRMSQNRLVWVQARGLADATSSEWRLVADTVEFDIVGQRVGGGRAWGNSTRPRAASLSYTISADSLALDAPGQRLTELRGFGHTYATSRSDSARVDADWMSGDTLVARFDSTLFSRSTLSRLTATGAARAYYHVPDPKRPGSPGITYSRGTEIAARFTPFGLERVDVVGDGDGVYLEAGAPSPPPPKGPPPIPTGLVKPSPVPAVRP